MAVSVIYIADGLGMSRGPNGRLTRAWESVRYGAANSLYSHSRLAKCLYEYRVGNQRENICIEKNFDMYAILS